MSDEIKRLEDALYKAQMKEKILRDEQRELEAGHDSLMASDDERRIYSNDWERLDQLITKAHDNAVDAKVDLRVAQERMERDREAGQQPGREDPIGREADRNQGNQPARQPETDWVTQRVAANMDRTPTDMDRDRDRNR